MAGRPGAWFDRRRTGGMCRPVSGASMNPARSIGPALVGSKYRALWVYIFGPVAGAAAGAWAYNLVRRTDRTLGEIKSAIIRPAN